MQGKLQQADGGTLFLDEIGDMLQTRLLRVLEDRLVVPIGGEPLAVNVRIISATHRNLQERVTGGSFREDLFYRLNGLEVGLPALRLSARTNLSCWTFCWLKRRPGNGCGSPLRRVRRCWGSRGRETCVNCARC